MLIILPAMALVSFSADITWALFTWATIHNAVGEGCRYAIMNPSFPLNPGAISPRGA